MWRRYIVDCCLCCKRLRDAQPLFCCGAAARHVRSRCTGRKNARIGALKSKLVEIGTLNQKYRVDAPFTAIKPQDYRGLNNRNTYRLRFRVPISNCFITVAFYNGPKRAISPEQSRLEHRAKRTPSLLAREGTAIAPKVARHPTRVHNLPA